MYMHNERTAVATSAASYYALAFTPQFDAFMFERNNIGTLKELSVDESRQRDAWQARHFCVTPQSRLVTTISWALWALGIKGDISYESYQYRSEETRTVEFMMEVALMPWLHVSGRVEIVPTGENTCDQNIDITVELENERYGILVAPMLRYVIGPELAKMSEGLDAWKAAGKPL